MTDPYLGRLRLISQGLAAQRFGTPADAVSAFGAMQGQDRDGVFASIALRTGGALQPVLDAFDRGEVVRGYPMRGTVFAVAAADLAWMTDLMADKEVRAAERRRPRLGLTPDHLDRAKKILYEHSGPRARSDLFTAWSDAGIPTDGERSYHLLVHFISTGHAVYGSILDGDTAVHLAETWLPSGSNLDDRFNGDPVAATAELFLRYATSHGPVTERDFAWWTKLPLHQIRAAISLLTTTHCDHTLARIERDGVTYYLDAAVVEDAENLARAVAAPRLLPGFDEYILGYQDRTFAVAEHHHEHLAPGNNGVFRKAALRGPTIVGTWRKAGTSRSPRLEVEEFTEQSQRTRAGWERRFRSYPFPERHAAR